MLVISTFASTWITHIQIGYTIVIFIIYKFYFSKKKVEDDSESDVEGLRATIVNYTFSTFRAMIYIVTSIVILAVDFQIYPRSSAKTETYGVSIMDMGVGVYVIAHALKSIQKTTNTDFLKTVKQSSFLILMGLVRLISVKSTNYVEHQSEYGIHWNFFFTLALVKIIACIFQSYIRGNSIRAFMLAFIFSTCYQFILTKKKFSKFLLYEYTSSQIKNLNFFEANKTGICSCMGYFAIYFAGQSICIYISSKVREK